MRLVILESPYGNPDSREVEENIRFARACLHDCLMRGEAPYASHLLYTQGGVLDDNVPEERTLGIEAGLAWSDKADATVVYVNRGMSVGMKKGIARAQVAKRTVEFRELAGWK